MGWLKKALGVGKLTTAAGAGMFAVEKTFKWLRGGDGSLPVWGKLLAGVAALAAAVTNAVIRYPNMQRDRQKKKLTAIPPAAIPLIPLTTESRDGGESEESEEKGQNNEIAASVEVSQDYQPLPNTEAQAEEISQAQLPQTCCHPGFKTTRCGTFTYVSARVLTGGYSFYTALSGYLSAFSIAKFGAETLNAIFPDIVSDQIDDADWKLGIIHVFAAYLFLANLKAYLDSNLANILEDYLPDLINGKWRTYKWQTYLKVLPYILINAANAKFSLGSTAGLLNQYTLGWISPSLRMPEGVVTAFSSVGVTAYVANFSLVNIPSMHNLTAPVDNSVEYEEKVPECYRPVRRRIFKTAFFGDSVATGAVSARATAYSFMQMSGISDSELAVQISMLTVAGLFVTGNTFASDLDAYMIEMNRRLKERNAAAALSRVSVFANSDQVVGASSPLPDSDSTSQLAYKPV